MKKLLLITTLLASLLASPSRAQYYPVQSMVRNQPFPFYAGVAMDTLLYATIKRKLVAADTLRASSERSIKTLQGEIKALEDERNRLARLGQYDAGQATLLSKQQGELQDKLQIAQKSLEAATGTINSAFKLLPKRIRKALINPTGEQVATALEDYVQTLQRRKVTWSLGACLGGFVLGLLTVLL